MREIKFRALSLLGNYWEYGFYTEEGGYGVIRRNDSEPNGEGTPIIIKRETRCQYTGLTDRNGIEVFERDVLAAVIYDTDTLSSGTLRWEVFYNEDKMQFYVRDKAQGFEKPLAELRGSGIQYKVVGNTIEKPSLAIA